MKSKILFVSFMSLLIHREANIQDDIKVGRPVSHGIQSSKIGLPWTPPEFQNPGEALGLNADSFVPSEFLERSVQFWVKIYGQYNSQQGLIHDTENLNIVYDVVSFEQINAAMDLDETQKDKAREDLLLKKKAEIFESLVRISTAKGDEGLTSKDKNYRLMWEQNGSGESLERIADFNRIRFQAGQSDHFQNAIYLSGRYLPMMENVFAEMGLPKQLTRLVFVESSFNIKAKSKVGASGLWQIMPFSAKGYLKMNQEVDLRNDPEVATHFAAKMLKSNFEMLGSWDLAVTGYNYGPYGIRNMVKKNKTSQLSELIQMGNGNNFGFASRNFFACLLAVLRVEGHADQYFPGIVKAKPLEYKTYQVKNEIHFSDFINENFNGDKELAQVYNPHLQKEVYQDKIALNSKTLLMIPIDELQMAPINNEISNKIELVDYNMQMNSSMESIENSLASIKSSDISNDIRQIALHGFSNYRNLNGGI